MPTPKPPRSRAPNPLPIQFTSFTKEHFTTPEGIAFLNQWAAQITNAQNKQIGQDGPVVIPAGVDVAGASVTGLKAPTGESDAVSLSHSDSNYGSEAVSPQLDIGGKNTLKGLAYCYGQVQANGPAIAAIQAILSPGSGVSGTLTIPKLTTANGSLTFVNGIIVSFVQPT